MSSKPTWSYEEYRSRLDTWIGKNEKRGKVLHAQRAEREQIKRASGGKAIAEMLMKPTGKVQK